MKNILLPLLVFGLPASITAAEAPLWLRDAKISPDGTQIAFTYKGDIYRVASTGGEAVRLTSQPSYETAPIWSPDGKHIAFASDKNGNFDIFMIGINGGEWKQITFNAASETPEAFSPDGKSMLYSASIQDPAQSALFPTSRMSEVYEISLDGGRPRQILATPARAIAWAPDGKSFLYQDVKGFEDEWRKHHTSSVTRDIWRYTPSTGKHTQLTTRGGEDLHPVDAGDEIFFLSERGNDKSINVYVAPASAPESAKAITSFRKHPVRFLSRAKNGMLCYVYNGEIYTQASPDSKPAKVRISITADYPDEKRYLTSSSGAEDATVSPNGKMVAFIYRGDVYVTSVEFKTTKQITKTPQAESDVVWADDNTLLYTSERDGKYNIYKAELERPDFEPDFVSATLIKETPMFANDGHERTVPRMSPDGKTLAFILDRTKLAVMDVKSKKVRQLTDGSTHRQRNGGFYYRWSPDSRWIALEIVDRKHDPYTDVAIINVEDGKLTNLTNSGYFDAEPKWILGGNAIAYATERYGMRNHASWGSQMDVNFIFLNQKAYDDFMRSKEDRQIDKETAKLAKKKDEEKDDKDKKDSKDDKKKDSKKDDKAETINVEYAGLDHRRVRITPLSTDLRDMIVDKDGETLYFISGADDGTYLWTVGLDDLDLELKKTMSDSGATFDYATGSDEIFIFGNSLNKLNGTSLKGISYRAEMTLDPIAEREFMFDNMVREESERFYTADMHGVDWPSMAADYRRFLPHINNNYDFAELLSEILGELNVSHTGGRFYGSSETKNPTRTAYLGALYDMNYTGKGMKIDEVLENGPLYSVSAPVTPGSVIEKINGNEITDASDISRLLEGTAGKRTLVSIYDPSTKTRRDTIVKPVSAGRQNSMLYRRWVEQRAADVDRWSNGRLGYVHISSMDDASFRKVYSDLLGKYNDREGIVIDIRWNGGGRLHEDIEVLFSGDKYFTQEIRGDETCDMPSRRWNKPSIMLMSEACYSNAHGTPWVYKHRNLGKLVGMPVPGTMTSVNWVSMQDPTLIYGIPVVGYRLADGSVLENQQLEPDIKVANSPETIVSGTDTQLRAAVDELLRQLDRK